MRILKIYDGDYPWDVRVEKIAQSLLGAGHEVRLLCRNLGGRPRSERAVDGLEIVRLPTPAPLSIPFPANPIWWQQLRGQLHEYRPERILVRDLPLAPLAVASGRSAGIPVIADLSEPYPDSLRSQRQFQRMTGIRRWVRNPTAADVAERYVVRRIDRALVVCPEAGRRLERQGLPADRWVEVGNTPRLDVFAPEGEAPPEIERLPASFVIFFAGLLAGDRGLDVALVALSRLEAIEPGRFGMVIAGAGPMTGVLTRQVEALRLSDRVLLPGFVPHHRLPDWITRVQLGLLPFHACPHIDSTLANKLFEFMALGLPVVVSDVPPMRRVLEETGAGVLFRSGDPDDLARAIRAMASDPKAAREHGEAGARAVRSHYHWGVDEERLLRAFARL